jgi:hypothetical protein
MLAMLQVWEIIKRFFRSFSDDNRKTYSGRNISQQQISAHYKHSYALLAAL